MYILVVAGRTGGDALPRGIGCGATGPAFATGAVSAQNQPIVEYREEVDFPVESEE